MALVIENGSGDNLNANSYVDLSTATVFFTARGLPVPTEALLIQAMDAIESLAFVGLPTNATQPLSFPRSGIADKSKVPYDENTIPRAVVTAQLWLTYYISSGFNPTSVARQAVKKEKVDVLETEFFPSGSVSNTSPMVSYGVTDLPNVINVIRHLLLDESLVDDSDSTDCFANGRSYRA